MKSGLIFLLALGFAISGCKKSAVETNTSLIPSITFYTSLKDTLAVKTFNELAIANVVGIKVRQAMGVDVRYFEYEYSDPGKLLNVISRSPFSASAVFADTTPRLISSEAYLLTLQQMANLNEHDQALLEKFDEGYEVFECIKSPLIHHLIINRNNRKIYHRITVEG